MNHQQEALEALKAAKETPADGTGTDPWLLAAQVHATLALVEQQRVHNILTWSAGYPLSTTLTDEITESLGLGETR